MLAAIEKTRIIDVNIKARPKDYEELIKIIHNRYEKMSKSYKKISVYLTQNPNEVAVKPVNSIAAKIGVHASSFVRYAQALGYEGFKDLQSLFQKRLTTAAPGFEARSKALEEGLVSRGGVSEFNFLHEMVVQDMVALEGLLNDIAQEKLSLAVDLIDGAEDIYIVGQLRSAPVALMIRYMLTMLGKRCILLDAGGGLATHQAKAIRGKDALIAVSFRFYANETVSIIESTATIGTPIVAISDSTLSPLAKSANVLFTVPERDSKYTYSLAATMCLVQSLIIGVAARVQDNTSAPRIPVATETQP